MSNSIHILVTGADGQLGNELRVLAPAFPSYRFFLTRREAPVTDKESMSALFRSGFSHVINCAAYTAVDKAESDREAAFEVNANAPGMLSQLCRKHDCRLIHISTDYVFDGEKREGYLETDETGPINIYGESKLRGEQLVMEADPRAMVIRTSWLYSSFGKNFVKTMMRLMEEKDKLAIVDDQRGCPTYAGDLASAIMMMIVKGFGSGVYHYANAGVTTWFGFAGAIKEICGYTCTLEPVASEHYVTPAKRPGNSILLTDKFRHTFGLEIPGWKQSLERCIHIIRSASR